MTCPDGHEGWLATGRNAVRAVLADNRFSIRPDLMHFPFADTGGETAPPSPPGAFGDADPPEHTRYRRALTGQFTVRRMRQLTERIEEITAEHLTAMEKQGTTADLVPAFALPVPALMICELLGVPYTERERFQADAIMVTGSMADFAETGAAFVRLQEYMGELVTAKRVRPQDDLISGIVGEDFTDEELVNMSLMLLGGGLDTTTNVFATGLLELLRSPELVAELRAKPEEVVEELLRRTTIIPTLVRSALEDVEIDGQVIKAGDTVALSLETANLDRSGNHIAFGHGIHQCLGQQLARVVLGIGFPALFEWFPKLRLAVPEAELPVRPHALVKGLLALPVRWD
ncbi:cytochrome P450 [Lentzea tibetensis]|uniref:Cytochrome P450 n=2 Tax=Lentzea tibetensis TaxID=2591470 RepID=A0A563EP45_9PSEU|nr:cytochrome P450 [Lentzea tibetensis]